MTPRFRRAVVLFALIGMLAMVLGGQVIRL
jgi:hypothetical protein